MRCRRCRRCRCHLSRYNLGAHCRPCSTTLGDPMSLHETQRRHTAMMLELARDRDRLKLTGPWEPHEEMDAD